ncbi:MAG: hypothetical protein JW776_03585 [Candidatus Lokiarchaeota archaeon]|nr:hypothetical protein [Candidatus Lokiarchaeota archaeon]
MSKKFPEKSWTVKIRSNSGSGHSFNLYDGNAVLGEYILIRRNYFDDLIKEIKLNKAYSVEKSIQKITDPNDKDWTNNPMILILASNKENDAPLWLLIKRENNLNGYLAAIGPKVFCEYLIKEPERIEEIRKFLEYMVIYSQKWAIVALIPAFLM